MCGRKAFQMLHSFADYQARPWSRAQKIITNVEITQRGSTHVRFVVTNMSGLAGGIHQGVMLSAAMSPNVRPVK
jgi:hypothetical protein